MVDRAVKVTLSASMLSYQKGMRDAAEATRKVGAEGEKLAQMREAYDGIGRGAVVMGGLIAAGIGVAIARFAEFDAAMSNVQAATHESSTNMGLLRDAAIEAGSRTVFSATEAAGAVEELAKAGVSTADILSGGLAGSLDLAAAGELGVARAAEITSTALNQFGLDGQEASHVADVLAAGAGKAMGSVEDLANGLKFVGPVAASMGVSLEETTGVLALFAQEGIIGEQAGTSLRGVLSSLTAPSSQARSEIERLGLSLYDSNGKFLGLKNAAGQLAAAYGGMDDASRLASMGIIFGRETITAATALYQAGAGGVEEWTAAVDDSGYAAETARLRLDNLKGDIEALGGAMDAALIQTGSAANDTLRMIVQSLTGLAEMYGGLPEPVQAAVLAIGVGTAAVALFGGTAVATVPKVLQWKATVDAAGLSLSGIALKAGLAGVAVAGLTALVGYAAAKQAEAQAQARAYADTLDDVTGQVTDSTREMAKEALAAEKSLLWMNRGSAYDAAEKLGLSLNTVTEAAIGNVEAFTQLEQVLKAGTGDTAAAAQVASELGISLAEVSSASSVLSEAVLGESQSVEQAKRMLEQKAQADEASAETSETAAAAYLNAASGAKELTSSLNELIDAVMEANGVGQDAISQNIAYQDALAEVDETIAKAREGQEGYSLTLDMNTEAGRKNMGMLVGLASDSQSAAKAQYELDGNTAAYRATLEAGRQALVDRATQLGMNADEAGALADQIYRIPSETEWKVIAETSAAQRTIDSFIQLNSQKVIGLKATVDTRGIGPLAGGYKFAESERGNLFDYTRAIKMQKFENGGFPSGIYRGTEAATHKFAEKATIWEAYISGKPSERERNIRIWEATGDRLGVSRQAPVIVQAPSLDGLAIVGRLEMGDDGFIQIIDGRIAAADAASERRSGQGRRVR